MSFSHAILLWLLVLPFIAGAAMSVGDARRRKAAKEFARPERLAALVTFDAGNRRALKAALRLVGLALAIVAIARPRYGRGEKVVPAADVSAVVVLDVSKSMYAEDVKPSRLESARNDVTRMITTLPQIRWGAVAFAGEAVAFPPTTDAPEAAQFLRAHEPNEMPGGTAIARALELARRQLVPQGMEGLPPEQRRGGPRHRSVIVLVTDGEDLEGDPTAVARQAAPDGVEIDVVALGARAPQPIPEIDESTGKKSGYARDEQGTLVTTSMSAAGEAQLQSIAAETRGTFTHALDGTTGLLEVEKHLKSMIANEGTGHVETLYADVFAVPLSLALLLLILEALIGEAPRRRSTPEDRA
ncbi:MAG: VWA domain-containing protein [Polyangiales bacterium]